MNAKEKFYSGMAAHTISKITANRDNWTSFLNTMGRNYGFTYPEQIMIHSQRPDATLCKEYDAWREEKNRYVKRGSKGIALFVMDQDKPYLRYVLMCQTQEVIAAPARWRNFGIWSLSIEK